MLIFGKKPKYSSKIGVCRLLPKIYFADVSFFTLKIVQKFCKKPIFGKNQVLQLWPKMLSANQIMVLFDHKYLRKESSDPLDFCNEIMIKERQHLKLPICLVVARCAVLSNQIAAFFDHQYLQKELTDVLDFFHGDNHHRKLASETTSFSWVMPVVPFSGQIAGFFDHQHLWKKYSNLLKFLHEDSH